MSLQLTYDLLDANKSKMSEVFRDNIKKLYNRRDFKPEFDNCYIVKPSIDDTGIAAIVKVGIIETVLKPTTFILYWKIHTSGLVEPFDGDPMRIHGPNSYARQMFVLYTEPVEVWIEQVRGAGAMTM